MEKEFERVAARVLEALERYLESGAALDPQKCKHITGTLKDIRELQAGSDGPKQILVMFDPAAEEAAM